MNKFISAIIAASMLATSMPAVASSSRHDPRWGNDRNHHSPYYNNHRRDDRRYDRRRDDRRHYDRRRDRGVSTGEAIAIGVGGLILGAVIADSNRKPRRENEYVCEDVIKYDYYGRPYVSDRNCYYR